MASLRRKREDFQLMISELIRCLKEMERFVLVHIANWFMNSVFVYPSGCFYMGIIQAY